MNDEKLNVKLKIAGKSYAMAIDPAKEEVYRLAERELNGYIALYEKKHLDGYATHDYLAIIALQLMVNNIRHAQSRELGSEDMARLAELVDRLDRHLNR